MIGYLKKIAALTMWVTTCLFFPVDSHGEFFKYVDESGRLVFVDDLSKIPPEYRKGLEVYKEQYDHLPEKERIRILEQKRRMEERQQQEEKRIWEAQQRLEAQREEAIEREQARIARENALKGLKTKVSIRGNQVWVPVKLGFEGNEIETLLLLDTGASIMALHREIAEALDLRGTLKGKAQVASGKVIDTRIAKLGYVQVGPIRKENLQAGIIDHQGPSSKFSGLLGMNFLRDLRYDIDFKNQVIWWK